MYSATVDIQHNGCEESDDESTGTVYDSVWLSQRCLTSSSYCLELVRLPFDCFKSDCFYFWYLFLILSLLYLRILSFVIVSSYRVFLANV